MPGSTEPAADSPAVAPAAVSLPDIAGTADGSSFSPLRRHAYWLLPLAVAAALASPHLAHPFWQDEITTEVNFAHNPLAALTHYQIPNNHILFSLQWWAFRQVVEDPALWRLLPFAFFLAAAAFMALAGRRLAGDAFGGALAGMVFATAHPILSFGVELRGYSPSMAYVAVALYALARWREEPQRRWLVLYGIMAFLAVGTVPVNLAAFAPLALWVWWITRPGRNADALPPPSAGHWQPALWCALSPFSGLAFLVPVWRQIPESLAAGSTMAKTTFLLHYPYATLWDFLWLLIVAGALALLGKAVLRRRARITTPAPAEAVAGPSAPPPSAAPATSRDLASASGFLALALFVPMACALALPRTPNDYTLIVTVPAICLGLAWTARAALGRVQAAVGRRTAAGIGVALLAALLALGALREYRLETRSYDALNRFDRSPLLADLRGGNTVGFNLYWQKFQNNREPITIVDDLAARLADHPEAMAFVYDDTDDPVTHAKYWEWRHRETLPRTLFLYNDPATLTELEGDPQKAGIWSRAWADSARRFMVVGWETKQIPTRVINLLSPGRRGVLIMRLKTPHFQVGEWFPDLDAVKAAKAAGRTAAPTPSPPAADAGPEGNRPP